MWVSTYDIDHLIEIILIILGVSIQEIIPILVASSYDIGTDHFMEIILIILGNLILKLVTFDFLSLDLTLR